MINMSELGLTGFGGDAGYSGFQMPSQFGQASNVYGQMAETGMPTSSNNYYQSAKRQAGFDVMDAINQALDLSGSKGMRGSSSASRMAGDIASRRFAEMGTNFASLEAQLQEAARQRQLAGAAGLQGVGWDMFNMPTQWANNAMAMGNSLYGTQGNQLDAYKNEMYRMMPENNPYFNIANQGMNANSMVGPEQYNPSFMTQLLGLGTTLGSAALMGGGSLSGIFGG